jgi:uncharacterized protein (TIGR02646 family)
VIRVRKPAAPPAVLVTRGAAETARMCAAYLANRRDYRSGRRRFEFDRKLYGAPEVRRALLAAQHGKCAFCEARIAHVMYGDVEHFRPKGGFRRGKRLMLPGYYWLAYAWDNLLLACQLCNQRHKRSAFPLAKGAVRVRSHLGDLTKERPRFVHPANEDPEQLIGFREHVAYPIGDNPRALATITGLGLNREEIKAQRRRHWETLTHFLRVAHLTPTAAPSELNALIAEAIQAVAGAISDDAEYAAMARALLGVR